jgi:hypothetical protein
MKCFYHLQIDAVAICKNCNKGLCSDCAVELINGIACKNRCESEVKAIVEYLERGKTAYKKVGQAYTRNSVIYGLMGMMFVVFGGITFKSPFWLIFLPLGIVCLLGCWFSYSTGRKMSRVKT